MDIGVIRERGAFDRRVALTPPVVRRLAGAGHIVWVETGAGEGAMFRDTEYIRAGAPHRLLAGGGAAARGAGGQNRPPHLAGAGALPSGHGAHGLLPHGGGRSRAGGNAGGARPHRHRLRDHPAGDGPPARAGGHQRNCRTDDRSHRRAPAAVELRRPRHPARRNARSAAGARGHPGRGRRRFGGRANGRRHGRARHGLR